MKATAPEKIYLFENPITETPDDRWLSKRSGDTDIEYTRTDVFIEKVCKCVEHLLSGYIIRNFNFGDSYEMDTLIEDVKEYMKGE